MSNLFKSITRYTAKAIGIIVDRHAPVPSGKLTVDPQGEYMEVKDLVSLLQMGVLIELTPELNELLKDGDAQRALLRDLTALGYEDFDQVMKVLKDQRGTVLKERKFEVWSNLYQATGEYHPPVCYGVVEAISFEEACLKLYDLERTKGSHKYNGWTYHEKSNTWSDHTGRLKPNNT